MRYAGIIYDDTAAAPGLCLSFYTQGCPIHCEGCHNPETWDEEGGHEFTSDTMKSIIDGISKNGITRSFAVLGGEPLSQHNLFLTAMVVQAVREAYPNIQIWVWSGYNMKELIERSSMPHMKTILSKIDVIVAGPFNIYRRDITLPYRGSSNQKIWIVDHEKKLCYNKEKEEEEYILNV